MPGRFEDRSTLGAPKRGARRATLERCYAAHALACLVIAVLAALADISSDAGHPAPPFMLVVLGLIAATFYRQLVVPATRGRRTRHLHGLDAVRRRRMP